MLNGDGEDLPINIRAFHEWATKIRDGSGKFPIEYPPK
jgi:hypothetical protein